MAFDPAKYLPKAYTSNWTQLFLMSAVMFMGPGIFNAMTSIGLGGNPDVGNIVMLTLFAVWIIASFIAPTLCNLVGAKWGLFIGALGYPPFALAMYFNAKLPAVFAGAWLGICAGFLWTAQGQLMMSYPADHESGTFIGIFWCILCLGSVMGAGISMGMNWSDDFDGTTTTTTIAGVTTTAAPAEAAALSAATYWFFFALMCAGAVLALLVLPVHLVRRRDGTMCGKKEKTDVTVGAAIKQELMNTFAAFTRPHMLMMAPLFAFTNFFYHYVFESNGKYFNARGQSLGGALYWIAQILGSFVMQRVLDNEKLSLKARMYGFYFAVVTYLAFAWSFGGWVQFSVDIDYNVKQSVDIVSRYPVARVILSQIFYGFGDSITQLWSYWVMRQMSSDSDELARFSGFYKFFQNVGGLVAYMLAVSAKNAVLDYWVNVGLIISFTVPTFFGITRVLRMKAAEPSKAASFADETN